MPETHVEGDVTGMNPVVINRRLTTTLEESSTATDVRYLAMSTVPIDQLLTRDHRPQTWTSSDHPGQE